LKHNVLTTRQVEAAKGTARLCDGAGLYLQVSRSGTKSWVYRYDIGGRTREMGLGSAKTVSLKLARELAREQREHLLRGDDPIEVRLAKRDRARALSADRILFKDAAKEFIAVHGLTWRNAKHRKQWLTTITRVAIEKAKEGDMAAIRVCLDRLAPPRKDRPIAFSLPKMEKASDAAKASAAIVEAAAEGELTPSEAGELLKIVESYTRSLQASDFEARLERLEQDKGIKR
jgi:hypothetical protein